ncbi:MAG: beta-propeller fold lactonase family protein [Phycisphaeraceae bacterium]|nr:MAG: beta-propeller fold lactonase family protein [Phycisphaeraceae bacterium]
MTRGKVMACLAMSVAGAAWAEPFQLICTVTPPGNNANPANWQPTKRYRFADTFGAVSSLVDIPKTEVFDPAGVAFRASDDLFIGNRHGNVLGQGSLSRFHLSPDGTTATYVGNITAAGMVGVHEMAYNAEIDELLVSSVSNGIFRFRFNAQGEPVLLSQFMNGMQTRGVAVHPSGEFAYVTAASNRIRVFRLNPDGTVAEQTSVFPAGASNLHFFQVSTDGRHLYVADISSSRVFRFRMSTGGDLTLGQTTVAAGAVDVAFSPDGREMFVGNHLGGGINRFTLDLVNDVWNPTGFVSTPSMGGFGVYNAPPCIADFNNDGFVDFFDFDAYVLCFEGEECPLGRDPDFNGDGFADFLDFDEFIRQFERGC